MYGKISTPLLGIFSHLWYYGILCGLGLPYKHICRGTFLPRLQRRGYSLHWVVLDVRVPSAALKIICCIKPYQIKGSECQYMIYCTANISHIALWLLTRRATANTIEPLRTACIQYLMSRAQQPKRLHKLNFPGYSYSYTVLTWCVEPRMAGQTLLLPDSWPLP